MQIQKEAEDEANKATLAAETAMGLTQLNKTKKEKVLKSKLQTESFTKIAPEKSKAIEKMIKDYNIFKSEKKFNSETTR